MKKVILLMLIPVLLTGCKKQVENVKSDYKIEVDIQENCNQVLKDYYQYGDKKIQIACINEINLVTKFRTQTLKSYLENSEKSEEEILDEFTSKLEFVDAMNDGGTSFYKNDDITVIRCHKLGGNNNTIISTAELKNSYSLCE